MTHSLYVTPSVKRCNVTFQDVAPCMQVYELATCLVGVYTCNGSSAAVTMLCSPQPAEQQGEDV